MAQQRISNSLSCNTKCPVEASNFVASYWLGSNICRCHGLGGCSGYIGHLSGLAFSGATRERIRLRLCLVGAVLVLSGPNFGSRLWLQICFGVWLGLIVLLDVIVGIFRGRIRRVRAL